MLASFSTLENAFKDIMMPSRPAFSIIYVSTMRWWKYKIFSFVHTIYVPPFYAEIKNEEICKSKSVCSYKIIPQSHSDTLKQYVTF